MIQKLTKKQEKQLEVYRDKWLKIGLSTDPCDRTAAEQAVQDVYKVAGLKPPKECFWFDSPVSAIMGKIYINELIKKKTPINKIKDMVAEQDINKTWHKMKDNIDQLQINEEINNQIYGNQDAGWLSFYNYFLEVLNLKCCEPLKPLMELAKNCGWWAPYDKMAILQEKPCEIHWSGKILHNENGPAIKYRDGFVIYILNGIRVPEWLVTTHPDKINVKEAMKEQNAEIRREIVRKLGIERIYKSLGAKVLDSKDDYELVVLNLGDDLERPYLKMKNPSIDTIHLEGVDPNCDTVEKALMWRNNLEKWEAPLVLT